jgi:hypothetical protein
LRPAAFFCAVVPPCDELLRRVPEPDCFPPRLEAPGELAIRAARSFDIPFFFSFSYCFSFLTLGRLFGIRYLLGRFHASPSLALETSAEPCGLPPAPAAARDSIPLCYCELVVTGSFGVSASCSFAVSSSDSDFLMTLPPYCSSASMAQSRRLLDDHEQRRGAGLDLVPDLLLKLLVDRLLAEVAEERSESSSECATGEGDEEEQPASSAVPSPG